MEPEISPIDEFISNSYIPIVSYVSAFLVLLVILFMIGMSVYDYKLVDRVSLRLQTALAFYALWLHSGSLWRVPFTYTPSPICTFFGWNMVAITTFDAFINVSIALNLQLVFIHNVQVTKKIEIAYWLVPIIMSLLISFPPLALGKLGWSDYAGCYVAVEAGDESYMKIFDFFATQLWRLIALIYLVIVVVIVFMKLNRGATLIDSLKLNMDSGNSSQASRAIRLLGYRVLLYPISMLITHSGGIISQIYYDFNDQTNLGLDRWAFLTYPLIGTLNFVAFCCDPTVHNAIRVSYYRIKGRYNGDIKNVDQLDLELGRIGSSLEGAKGTDIFDNDYTNNQAFSALVKSL